MMTGQSESEPSESKSWYGEANLERDDVMSSLKSWETRGITVQDSASWRQIWARSDVMTCCGQANLNRVRANHGAVQRI